MITSAPSLVSPGMWKFICLQGPSGNVRGTDIAKDKDISEVELEGCRLQKSALTHYEKRPVNVRHDYRLP